MRRGLPSIGTLLTCAFVGLGVLWGGLLGLCQIKGVGSVLDRFEYLTVDLRFVALGGRPPRDVAIVAIDDETLRDIGAYPLPRGAVARLVGALAAVQPRVIAIDIAFLDAGPPDDDAALAAALGAKPSVIAAIGQFQHDETRAEATQSGPLALVPRPERVLWPTPTLGMAARPGLVNVVTDLSGIPRFIPMLYRMGDGVMPSFVLAAAAAASRTEPAFDDDGAIRLGSRRIPMDLGYHLAIRYHGSGGGLTRISAARVLRGEFDPADVRGKTVVLGVTASGVGDMFATPFDRVAPGVEVLATGIANLLAGDALVRTKTVRQIDAAAAILLACGSVLLMSMRRTFLGLGLVCLMLALWGVFTVAAFAEGYWFGIAVPLAAVTPVALGHGAARLGAARFVAGRLATDKATLMRFQSPLLLRHILANPTFLDRPVRQDLAIVFVDLSGFTGVAEALGPERTRDMLAAFQVLVEREVAAWDGYVVSFMGDGAMIAFGLPAPRPDDAARAIRAIADLHAALTDWIATLPMIAKDRLTARIGGHYGPAVASRLGPAHHQHITATGDTVNVASRLLEVSKQQGGGVIVSNDLVAAAGQSVSPGQAPPVASLEVAIRGRRRPLRVQILR